MRGEVITLDLETTGLDPDVDLIIEVGIICSKDDEIVEEFHTMVNPGIEIPPRVVMLTNIRDEDVRHAPNIHEVLPKIRDFIGDRPIIGHKVDFDLGMLERYRVGIHNTPIDTYEIAAVMLPTAPRYNLNSLVQELDLTLEHAHRALDDAVAAWRVYRRLWEKILVMDVDVLREIVDHAAALEWNAKASFVDALNFRLQQGEVVTANKADFPQVFFPAGDDGSKLRPNQEKRAVDPAETAKMIAPGGELEKKLPGYEVRDSQARMSKAVANAFNKGEHLMIEAPTGTGKSLAYLIPSAQWAMLNNERVVVSTHTINLQDQLLQKDIPLLQGQLKMPFTAADLKGRGNYICPRRFSTLRRRKVTSVDELRVLAKALVWLSEGKGGALTEMNLRGGSERMMWYRMTAQDEGCTLDRCKTQMRGVCPFYKARVKAEHAHVLVVNHALLLADVAVGNRVLPEYDYLVLDEAHHLEDAITDGLSQQVDKYGFLRKIGDLGDTGKGLLGDALGTLQTLPSEYYDKIKKYVEWLVDAVGQMGDHVRIYFDDLATVVVKENPDRNDYLAQIRVTDQMRKRNDWGRISEHWRNLSDFTTVLSESLMKIAKAISDLSRFKDSIEDYDNLLSSIQAAATQMEAAHLLFKQFTTDPQPNTIYWVEVVTDNKQVTIKAAPLHVGELMQRYLWEAKASVVLTSATLCTANKFDYISERLSAVEVTQATLPSPFDYVNSTLLYLPTDIPEPNQRKGYQEMVERGIIELASVTEGKMLCLFTSYHQLKETASAVTPRLALGDIIVYDQSSGSSRQVLLDSFKSTEKAVLMGTRSFWEGIDVPGDDLSVVVIVRLPFAVPSDPIFAARSEMFGDKSFGEYSVPDAILRFRQGFGRLIRRKSDRGIVVVMDSRIVSKGYGNLFINSLPKTTLRRGPLAHLPKLAAEWLKK